MNVFIHPAFEDAYQRQPLVLVDVGARGGLRNNWVPARRHLTLIGFEPDPRECRQLQERAKAAGNGDLFYNTALHNRRGPVTLYLARDRGLSSIFKPDRGFLDTFPEADRFDTTEVQEMQADTLDSVLAAGGVSDVDFIKADTQGSELHVLEGAAGLLAASVVGVEVEVEFSPIYIGQPLFADVDQFMRARGFHLFDLRPCYWKRTAGRAVGGPRGQMIWADALYCRSLPSLHDAVAPLDTTRRRSKLLRAISVALLYGYYDYALEIARSAHGAFSDAERRTIDAALRQAGTQDGGLPRFPGRRSLAAAAHRLWKMFVQRDDAWSVSNAKLGN